MNTESLSESRSRLIPVTKWNEHYEWPSIGGLRHLIFNAQYNGFDKVVRRCGRRVLIDVRVAHLELIGSAEADSQDVAVDALVVVAEFRDYI